MFWQSATACTSFWISGHQAASQPQGNSPNEVTCQPKRCDTGWEWYKSSGKPLRLVPQKPKPHNVWSKHAAASHHELSMSLHCLFNLWWKICRNISLNKQWPKPGSLWRTGCSRQPLEPQLLPSCCHQRSPSMLPCSTKTRFRRLAFTTQTTLCSGVWGLTVYKPLQQHLLHPPLQGCKNIHIFNLHCILNVRLQQTQG